MDNTIFIGGKPLVNYIKAIITQFNIEKNKEVIVKSRGKFISKAVDTVEVARRGLDFKVKEIKIGSEKFNSDIQVNVSTMEILLEKN